MSENRKNHLDVEIQGRKFRIRKFNAMDGCYIIYQLMSSALPAMFGTAMKKELPGEQLAGLPAAGTVNVMDKKTFQELQAACLGVCYEVLPAGEQKVLEDNGTWGVLDLENNAPFAFMLTVKALVFNVADFFGGATAEMMATSFRDLFPLQ